MGETGSAKKRTHDPLMTFPFGKVREGWVKQDRWLGGLFFLTAVVLVVLASVDVRASEQTGASESSHRVLVLYSDERLLPANIIVDEAIHATFTADTRIASNFTASSLT